MSASRRAATIVAMYRGQRSGLGRRAHDNCWEMGDGDQVHAILARRIAADRDLAERVARGRAYRCGYLERGEYDYGEPVWRFVPYSLLAVAAETIEQEPDALWPADVAARVEEERRKRFVPQPQGAFAF